MHFVVGSAILVALVFLIFSATVGTAPHWLVRLRHLGYALSCALAGLVTGGDILALVLLLALTLALYEATARLAQ